MKDLDELVYKVKVIAHGSNRIALEQFVDFLYNQEEFDEEPLSPECQHALAEVDKAVAEGDYDRFTPWEEIKKELDV